MGIKHCKILRSIGCNDCRFLLGMKRFLLKCSVFSLALLTSFSLVPEPAAWSVESNQLGKFEGPVLTAEIIAGPIDLHRKYKSMEGPFVNQSLRIGELLGSKHVEVPESLVHFVEGKNGGPAMMGGKPNPEDASTVGLKGIVPRTGAKRELFWFKGIKVDVFDENDQLMPTAEFICHFNLDVDPARRIDLFPTSERSGNARLVSLTQGQTEFFLPEGFAVPVASDEVWTFGFQAANRTSDVRRRVKHRCTVYFLKDSQLTQTVKPLLWYVPYCNVVVDRFNPDDEMHHAGPTCLPSQPGVVAPNRGSHLSVHKDSGGRRLAGHWVVPPGQHDYSAQIVEERDPGFAKKDRKIHAIWTHVHPLCTSTSLVECDGSSRRKVYQAEIETKVQGGLEIKHIETITSKKGIALSAGKQYAIEGSYNNTTGIAQDSMISHGIFFRDETFKKPDWVTKLVAEDAATTSSPSPAQLPAHRLFDPVADGPIIAGNRIMEIKTSAGNLHLILEPSLAPIHATQLHKLLVSGAFAGTLVFNCQPDYLIQFGDATFKEPSHTDIVPAVEKLLRRLPLEVNNSPDQPLLHQRWALSMARGKDSDSAVSSFCIMLNGAPHLDGKYTVFGHIVPDDVTSKTISRIVKEWPESKARVISAKEIGAYHQLTQR